MISAQKAGLITLLIVWSIALGACMRSRAAAGEIRLASLRSGICTLHHVPLRRVALYDISEPVPADPDLITYKLERLFPNADQRLERTKSRVYGKPVKVTECPICQQLSEKYVANHPNAP